MTTNRKFANAPESRLIPASLRTLAAEAVRVRSDLNAAKGEVSRLNDRQNDHRAISADREEVGTQIREGKTVKTLTPNADKLAADRTAAVVKVERLKAVEQSVNAELNRWLEENGEELTEYVELQRREAETRYLAAVAALEDARKDYHVAAETARWAEAARDPRTSHVNWSAAAALSRLDDGPMHALRKEAQGVRRHRTVVAG